MNKLSNEKSPYLLQHANNPVDWYPWGEEAFEKAKKENKPIFLSIGYSTCHWCHVMEHESFENEKIAEAMNKYFVNIKVDREERPDVDKVYMTAVQTMTGQGGWPLSVFLTPELKPFYGGTYFPPHDAHGRPGFPTLLQKIAEVWHSERENVLQSGEELTKALQHRHYVDSEATEIDEAILKRTYHQIAAGYDPKYAGFGSGPKFPRPVVLNFLFRYYYRTKEEEALRMALTTLKAMASGGMYDHLGGGFHRYSVDGQWRVPHFEKMLYDQAQLAHSYLDAYQITHDEFFANIAVETLDYILREMTSPEGGFYSAEDADSEDPENSGRKVEGAFYVWKKSEIEKILTKKEAEIFSFHFSVHENGNVLSDPQREFRNKNILFNPYSIEHTAKHNAIAVDEAAALLSTAKMKLFNKRSQRPRPHLDDKILTSWNGLMIGALARASRVLQKEEYISAAIKAADFIYATLYNHQQQVLHRRYRDGDVKFEAHLDDYAFLASGLLYLYQATYSLQWLQWADQLMGKAIALFWDSAEGGFYDTSGKDPSVLVRTKEMYDGAEPTGNSVAAMNLLRLYYLTNNDLYKKYLERTLKYFSAMLVQSPHIMPELMSVVEFYLAAPEHLVLVTQGETVPLEFIKSAASMYLPNLNTLLLNEDSKNFFYGRFTFLADIALIKGEPTAYYCTNFSCNLPVNDAALLVKQLSRTNQ